MKITSNPALMHVEATTQGREARVPAEHQGVSRDGRLRQEARGDRENVPRPRHPIGRRHDVLVFAPLRQGARRGEATRKRSATTVRQIWPNLEVMIGGGVSAKPYLGVLRDRLGSDDVTLVDTYNATEGGIYAASDQSGEPGLLMIPDRGVFFEFIPAENHTSPYAARVPLWEVERDRTYAIAVTTPSGLYAYKVGDLVRFPSLRPLRIEFVGRTAGCLSTTQELTTHAEIEQAMAAALERFGAVAVDFSAAADVGVDGSSRARYVVFVELALASPAIDPDAFIRVFDSALCAANRVYREHRANDTAILLPELCVLPSGSVRRFMGEVRGGNVQAKFPRTVDGEYQAALRRYAAAGRAPDLN